MRLFIAMILTLFLFSSFYPYTIHAAGSSEQSDHQLVKLTKDILMLSKQQRYEDAVNLLQHFSEEFLQSTELKNKLSMDELKLVSTGYSEAKDALKAASMDVDERNNAVLSFHLLIDAIYSEHQPLWRKMDNRIISPLDRMKKAVSKGEKENFELSFSEFKANYQQIKPALLVDLKEDQITRLDSYLMYLDQYEATLLEDKDKTIQHVSLMKEEFLILFDQSEKESADLSIPWLILTVGGVIVSTLIYVGWIKYKAERDKIRKYNRDR